MLNASRNSVLKGMAALLLTSLLATPTLLCGEKKKTQAPPAPVSAPENRPDFRKVAVFPRPPAPPRVRYMDYFSAERPPLEKPGQKQKTQKGWMDRLAGVSPDSNKGANGSFKPRFQLMAPYGVAVDSKGRLFVADTKVGAIFIFNVENNDLELIKHKSNAEFGSIFGLAMDDNDSLFVSDGQLHHIVLFDPQHKVEDVFGSDVLRDPNGMAIDFENRFLYVVDTELDQVLVFDADSHKLLRRLGTTGKKHTLTAVGQFAKPTGVAVDSEGLVYVTDTWNDRVEVFDADGNFVRTWGKNGDAAGDFARPKGIAIDSDGHIWVADAMLNRIQIFAPEGNLLLAFGDFGKLPGQFEALTGMAFDKKNNRVFTAEQYLGRVQMFKYMTDDETRAELKRKDEEREKKAEARRSSVKSPAADAKPETADPAVAAPSMPQVQDAKPPEATSAPSQAKPEGAPK